MEFFQNLEKEYNKVYQNNNFDNIKFNKLDAKMKSLILSEAIQKENINVVKEIIKRSEIDIFPQLMIETDKRNMSPMTYTLLLDDSEK